MILRALRALPGAARELASDVAHALTFDGDALAEWCRAEELADRLREAEARALRAEHHGRYLADTLHAYIGDRNEQASAKYAALDLSNARGQTIHRLQNRLARWKRRCRRLRDRQRPTGGPIVSRNKGAAGAGG